MVARLEERDRELKDCPFGLWLVKAELETLKELYLGTRELDPIDT